MLIRAVKYATAHPTHLVGSVLRCAVTSSPSLARRAPRLLMVYMAGEE